MYVSCKPTMAAGSSGRVSRETVFFFGSASYKHKDLKLTRRSRRTMQEIQMGQGRAGQCSVMDLASAPSSIQQKCYATINICYNKYVYM
jgi:hypothetical protein